MISQVTTLLLKGMGMEGKDIPSQPTQQTIHSIPTLHLCEEQINTRGVGHLNEH